MPLSHLNSLLKVQYVCELTAKYKRINIIIYRLQYSAAKRGSDNPIPLRVQLNHPPGSFRISRSLAFKILLYLVMICWFLDPSELYQSLCVEHCYMVFPFSDFFTKIWNNTNLCQGFIAKLGWSTYHQHL